MANQINLLRSAALNLMSPLLWMIPLPKVIQSRLFLALMNLPLPWLLHPVHSTLCTYGVNCTLQGGWAVPFII